MANNRLPIRKSRADSFRTDDSMKDFSHRGSVRHRVHGSEFSAEDEFADFGPKVTSVA